MSTGVYEKAAGDLIRDALRTATITGISLPVQPSDYAQGVTALNDVLASLQTKQIHIWSTIEALLPLNPNQQQYSLGLAGDHCFTDYVYVTTTADSLISTTTLYASTAGMTVGDFIGVELSDGTRQWTTIDTITNATELELVAALTAQADSGASVYAYTTKIDQPVRILSSRYASNQTASEIPTWQISRDEYYNQPEKTSTGSTNSWYYWRDLSIGKLNIWPIAENCTRVLRFTFIKPQYIPEDGSEDIAIPPEWYLPLKYLVAEQLGLIYAIDQNKQMFIAQQGARYLEDAIGTDSEFSSFSFYPEVRR
jgi:hypothetical protein